jgi:GNAT superfamily N-acetyltransferase
MTDLQAIVDKRVLIRDVEDGDADAIARLCSQLGYPLEAPDIPGRLHRFSTDSNAGAFVGMRDGDVIGLVTVHLRYTLNHEAPIAQLSLLIVDKAVRTRGVGRALVTAVEQWAKARGAKKVVVTTALDRDGAHAFYEKVGYAHTGRRYGKDLAVLPHD